MRRTDPRLTIIREAIQHLTPGATPAFLDVTITETFPLAPERAGKTWHGSPGLVAERVFTALYGRDRLAQARAAERRRLDVITHALTDPQITGPEVTHDTEEPVVHLHGGWMTTIGQLAAAVHTALLDDHATTAASPLAQAEDAKRRRDLVGELDALMSAGQELESAPWYPCRPGDLVHVAHDAVGDVPLIPAFGETYVIGDAGDGLLSMRLLAHGLADGIEHAEGMVGCFAAEAVDCPIYELWFEGGPHRLTIVRDGRVVHGGPARTESDRAAGTKLAAMTMAQAIVEAERYLERGEPELAYARLCSDKPLPPCGAPGFVPEHADCARSRGHCGACGENADYVEPPHECPKLPEQLHAVLTVGAKVQDVHLVGLYEDQEAAADHAMGFHTLRTELDQLTERFVKPAPGLPGEMVLTLPKENEIQATGVQLAVTVPLQILPDPREDDQDGYDYDLGDDYEATS